MTHLGVPYTVAGVRAVKKTQSKRPRCVRQDFRPLPEENCDQKERRVMSEYDMLVFMKHSIVDPMQAGAAAR